MTVIVGILGAGGAVVGSDSIRVNERGEAFLDFDKTFLMQDPPVMGAFSGMAAFGDRTVAEHLEVALARGGFADMTEVRRRAGAGLARALAESEMRKEVQRVELLLVGPGDLREGPLEMGVMDLMPGGEGGRIIVKHGLYREKGTWVACGDGAACRAVRARLQEISAQIRHMDGRALEALVREVIQRGIEACGSNPAFPHIPACGGRPCVRIMAQGHV
ncbi:MAG: hypothetical protein JW821_19560 [Deltaproteobacteria bacterium]|nr:hypothetical protein [Deltaproteobacteria bacterium]